ncbi:MULTISPECIES: hypothetical protein [unclassified Modestobacter]|uniref:hypothetical protein n=1 Tax=unclassified Modestobacter TaxID=2643866 RepID=UPI0022AB18F4|nr:MULTISPECIES: hypothetical protein [unclassified Modestobacter]MCZ2825990.1 hypothetical protein [Modestobacter sp. VKM Ac-2981]MCZ2852945.1 hypothetical protein [Modestobacter sp. VKM Ac-2982]
MSGLAAFEDGVVDGMQRARRIVEEGLDQGYIDGEEFLVALDRELHLYELDVRNRRARERRMTEAEPPEAAHGA